ncbi:MAG: phosphoribosylamine--glycine ligase [Bacteroidales bacterium]
MNVLIIGSGGREHALAWKIAQSTMLDRLFIAPGNAGTRLHGENVSIGVNDFAGQAQLCIDNQIDMVIVGPEEPLVKGLKDYFAENEELSHITIIGPGKDGANLEGSKNYAKEFMNRHNIPTARHRSFTKATLSEGIDFIHSLKPPYVLKADGLAAGKGVVILDDATRAENELSSMLTGKFGEAGSTVVIEEFLSGIEISVFVITDGKNYRILPEAKDYKRVGEGDTGLNTGGMGAISPVPFAKGEFMEKVEERIIKRTIKGLQIDNIPYMGFIFFGLIKVEDDPYVIEYNVRMGDPESEVVFPRVKSDFLELLVATGRGELDNTSLEIDKRIVSTIMLVSGGYPESYQKGYPIENLEETKECIVFHAGTSVKNDQVVTSGGRVIAVSGYGNSMKEALDKSYRNAGIISFRDKYFRKDIGFDL